MTTKEEYRELVPVTIAAIVLAAGAFFIWSDLRNDDAPSRADDIVTSAVVSRAGATLIPSAPPTQLAAPQTTTASITWTVGRTPTRLR